MEPPAHWRGSDFENAFQAILKPIFSYSMTSILSKVRHSNPMGGTLILSYVYVGSGYFFGGGGLKFR